MLDVTNNCTLHPFFQTVVNNESKMFDIIKREVVREWF